MRNGSGPTTTVIAGNTEAESFRQTQVANRTWHIQDGSQSHQTLGTCHGQTYRVSSQSLAAAAARAGANLRLLLPLIDEVGAGATDGSTPVTSIFSLVTSGWPSSPSLSHLEMASDFTKTVSPPLAACRREAISSISATSDTNSKRTQATDFSTVLGSMKMCLQSGASH